MKPTIRHAADGRHPVRRSRIYKGASRGQTPAFAVVVCFLMVCMLLSFPALAVTPDEMLKDPALEARARDISKDLRCLVCQGQAIDDSDADLAHDLRVLVRQRLQAGDTDE